MIATTEKKNGKILYEKTCINCGEKFIGIKVQMYCTVQCRGRVFNWKENMKEHKPKIKPVSLAEINRQAREKGMTYGQYMVYLERGIL